MAVAPAVEALYMLPSALFTPWVVSISSVRPRRKSAEEGRAAEGGRVSRGAKRRDREGQDGAERLRPCEAATGERVERKKGRG